MPLEAGAQGFATRSKASKVTSSGEILSFPKEGLPCKLSPGKMTAVQSQCPPGAVLFSRQRPPVTPNWGLPGAFFAAPHPGPTLTCQICLSLV